MTIERKFTPLSELKMSDEGNGSISGYRAIFGEIDSGGDIIVPGAFKDCIPEYLHSGFSAESHDWDFSKSVGFPVEAKEDGTGWFVKSEFHSVKAAQDVRTIAKERMAAGKQVGFSFGYKTDDYQTIEQKDFKDQLPQFIKADRLEENLKKAQQFSRIRILKKVSAIEDSLVTSPMNKLAGATAIKSEDRETKAATECACCANDKIDCGCATKDKNQPGVCNCHADCKQCMAKKCKGLTGAMATAGDTSGERKGMFEDAIEEREESFYFLTDTLQQSLYRADCLSDMDPTFDMAAALDLILAEFSARIRGSYLDPEEQGEDDESDDMGTMADRSPISFKGDLRGRLPYAKHAEMVLGAVEAFAQKSAAVTEMLIELGERRKQILGRVETKAGATYSAANLAHMQAIHDAMDKVAKLHSKNLRDMKDLIAKAKPSDASSTNGKSDADLDTQALRTQSLKVRSMALIALNS